MVIFTWKRDWGVLPKVSAAAIAGLLVLSSGCATKQERIAFDDFGRLETAAEQARLRSAVSGYNSNDRDEDGLLAELPVLPTVEDYVAYAALNNAGLEASFNEWKATLEEIPQARTLPDPRLNYRYFIENVETRVGPQEQAFGLSQTFPWFGELDVKAEMAVEAARVAQAKFNQRRLMLTYNVVSAYAEYAYQIKVIEIVRENRDLVKNLEEIARARFRAGAAEHPAVIRAQVELGRLEDRLRSAEALDLPLRAKLNALLNRASNAPVPQPALSDLVAADVKRDGLDKALLATNPQLLALKYEVSRTRKGIDLAKTENYPDITLGVDYIDTGKSQFSTAPDEGDDAVAVGISINLPIWKERNDAVVAEALSRFGASTKRQIDLEHTLLAELELALFKYEDAVRQVDLYQNTLLPKAEEALAATLTAFQGDTATFTDLIDAERVMLEFQLQNARAEANGAIRLAQIEMLVGESLSEVSRSSHAGSPATAPKTTQPPGEGTKP